MLCIVWSFWFWLFSYENIILIWCRFTVSTFLCWFLIQRRHRWFSSLYACWNALFCVTNKLIHIFQKQKSCHDVLFIKCKRNECISKLHNFFCESFIISKFILFTKLIAMIFIFNLLINFSKSVLKNKYNMNNINKSCNNFICMICFSIIQFIKMNMIFWFLTNDDIQLMIQLNIFFFENCESISYDLLLKFFLRRLCSTTSWFCLFQFFTLCAFVQWEILKWFLLICSIKFSFVQWIINHDASLNMTIFCWLLI